MKLLVYMRINRAPKLVKDGLKEAQGRLVLFVVGPTASGKTALAVELAKKFNGEVISLDSRQFYKGMDIGTAKVTKEEMCGIPHHLLDICEPQRVLTLVDVMKLALEAIEDCFGRNKLPICVGGTGLYVDALCRKYENFKKKTFDGEVGADEVVKLREKLGDFATLEIGIEIDRKELYERINKRTEKMFDEGLINEVKKILKSGCMSDLPALSGIGYKWPIKYLRDEISLAEAIELTKRDTRRYAKRQMTWFRHHGEVKWV